MSMILFCNLDCEYSSTGVLPMSQTAPLVIVSILLVPQISFDRKGQVLELDDCGYGVPKFRPKKVLTGPKEQNYEACRAVRSCNQNTPGVVKKTPRVWFVVKILQRSKT